MMLLMETLSLPPSPTPYLHTLVSGLLLFANIFHVIFFFNFNKYLAFSDCFNSSLMMWLFRKIANLVGREITSQILGTDKCCSECWKCKKNSSQQLIVSMLWKNSGTLMKMWKILKFASYQFFCFNSQQKLWI